MTHNLPFRHSAPNKNTKIDFAGVRNIVFYYAAFASIYIWLSDHLVLWIFSDLHTLQTVNIAKGWIFVVITSLLLYGFIRRLLRQGLQALQEREEGYRNLAEQSPAIIYQASLSKESKTTYISSRVTELGFEPEAWINSPDLWINQIHPDDLDRVLRELEHSHTTGSIFSSEYRLKNKDGEWRDYHDEARVVYDANHHPLYLQGMMLDITERKRIRQQLLLWSQAFEHSGFGLAITDPINDTFLSVNPAFAKERGYTPEGLQGMPVLSVYPPHLHDHVKQQTQALDQTGHLIYESEHLCKDGRTFPVLMDITSIKSNDGKALNHIAYALNISDRKEIEQALRIAATAFESHEGMVVTDENQKILKVNEAFTHITGYEAEEAIGNNPGALLKSSMHDDAFYEKMWESLDRNHHWQGEIWNKRKNGEIYPEWINITAVTNDAGKVTNYVASFSDMSEHKKSEAIIEDLAFHDPLTHLPNRRLLIDRLHQLLLSGSRHHQFGALLIVDLDDFKTLNDTKGHAVGDALLIEVAIRLQKLVHADDTVARIGGDEFAVILHSLDIQQERATFDAKSITERIHAGLRQPFVLAEYEYHGSTSIGIALFRDHEITVEELLKHADTAKNQAKQIGRNSIRFFDPAAQEALESRAMMESWMRKAIPDQYRLYYQIQVNEESNAIGAEALIRWHHPERGVIPPSVFIPLAEESGLILTIGQWVLEEACTQLKIWEQSNLTRQLVLAVNVSARQFHQSDFVNQVLTVLQTTGADPSKLKLELTESMLVIDIDDIITKMTALKNIGVKFSLDDFGTGFSSLTYLKKLPLSQLKIDQSFVRDALVDPSDAAIVRTIIALGQSLGLAVIAEGVETKEQRNFLAVHGCNHYQGYLYSQPLPLAEFEQLLLKQAG